MNQDKNKFIKIILQGNPIPKARPIITRNGSFDKQDKLKKFTKFQLASQKEKYSSEFTFPLKEPLAIKIDFYLECPIAKKNSVSWNLENHQTKPDIDNLEKFYLDCLNKIFYEDDRQIISTNINKFYAIKPRTEIHIMTIDKKINDKVKGILSMFEVNEFLEFVGDLNILADSIDSGALEREHFEFVQYEAAYYLSVFCEKYSSTLNKINKKYPKLHLELDQNRDQFTIKTTQEEKKENPKYYDYPSPDEDEED